MKKFKLYKVSVVVLVFMFGFIGSNVAFALTSSPTLGSLSNYSVVSSTFTNTNVDPQTKILGSVCATTQPTTVPLLITGTVDTPCAPLKETDQNFALADLNGQATLSCIPVVDTGGNPTNNLNEYDTNGDGSLLGTFYTGCYSTTGAMNVTTGTTVTLSGTGTFIFKSGDALTTGDNSFVVLDGANANDVFWIPVGATTIGANATLSTEPTFVGNIFRGVAAGLSITLGHFANLQGRTLAFGSTVTTDANTITTAEVYTLHIIKHVVNTGGGTAVASDFNVHVKRGGAEISGSPQDGAEAPGTSYSVSAGDFVISEDANSHYTQSFAGTCPGGDITVSTDSQDCTITNTYIIPVRRSSSGSSIARVVLPVFEPTIAILSTPVVVVAPIIPKLPKTGFAPQESGTWYQSLLNNILNLFR